MKNLLTYLILLIVAAGCGSYYNAEVISGTYESDLDGGYIMILKNDNTFKIDSVSGIDFWGNGTWKANGIDEQVEFYQKGHLKGWAMPSGKNDCPKLTFNLYDENEVNFTKTKCK